MRLGGESAVEHLAAAQSTIEIEGIQLYTCADVSPSCMLLRWQWASLCLVCVSEAGRLQHTWAHALIIDPVRHSSDHVWQQSSCAMNELAELVYLHQHPLLYGLQGVCMYVL